MKFSISLALLLLIYSCKNNTKSNTQSGSSNLQDTSKYLYFKDSLDIDTVYARGMDRPDSVSLFFRNAGDTLWNYVMKSYIRSNKKEILSIDSLKANLYQAGFIVFSCGKSLCGLKKEFNKRHHFELKFGEHDRLITVFEIWFQGQRFLSPTEMRFLE